MSFRQHWKLLIVPVAWFILALIVIGLLFHLPWTLVATRTRPQANPTVADVLG